MSQSTKRKTSKTSQNTPDDFSVQAILCFTYTDSHGKGTERVVEVKRFRWSSEGEALVTGYCRVRKALRSFRLDRLSGCIDTETGAEISDVYQFLYAKAFKTPEVAPELETWNTVSLAEDEAPVEMVSISFDPPPETPGPEAGVPVKLSRDTWLLLVGGVSLAMAAGLLVLHFLGGV